MLSLSDTLFLPAKTLQGMGEEENATVKKSKVIHNIYLYTLAFLYGKRWHKPWNTYPFVFMNAVKTTYKCCSALLLRQPLHLTFNIFCFVMAHISISASGIGITMIRGREASTPTHHIKMNVVMALLFLSLFSITPLFLFSSFSSPNEKINLIVSSHILEHELQHAHTPYRSRYSCKLL